jgi:hypothetical protein
MPDADIFARSSIPWVAVRSSATISIAGLVLCLLASPPVRAQNLVTDGDFETTQLGQGNYEYVNGLLNGWLYSGLAVLINVADNSPWVTPSQTGYSGNQVAGVQNMGSISQTFAAPGTGGFDVTWLDSGRPNYDAQNYTVSVLNNATGAIVSSETLTVTPGANFSPEALAASLVAGDSYSLTFQGLDSSGGDATAFIDDVDVSSGPAPAIGVLPLPMFIPFLAGFAWLHRRRTRGAA